MCRKSVYLSVILPVPSAWPVCMLSPTTKHTPSPFAQLILILPTSMGVIHGVTYLLEFQYAALLLLLVGCLITGVCLTLYLNLQCSVPIPHDNGGWPRQPL